MENVWSYIRLVIFDTVSGNTILLKGIAKAIGRRVCGKINMTNEKRIFELCGCVLDLIDELSMHDYTIKYRIEWIKNEMLELREEIYKNLQKIPPIEPMEFEPFKYEKPDKLTYEILKEGETYVIVGTLVEVLKRNVVMTDMHSVAYLHKVLRDRGIIKELRQMGATEKSTIIIAGEEFELLD